MNHALAVAHTRRVDVPDDVPGGRENSIVVRYDAGRKADGEVIYAMISLTDLAKLPGSVLEGINMLSKGPDGSLVGSPNAFFRAHPEEGNVLYVNTWEHGDFVTTLGNEAVRSGLEAFMANGDINAFRGPDGSDIDPPETPAFIALNMEHLPVRVAISELHALRSERENRADAVSPSGMSM